MELSVAKARDLVLQKDDEVLENMDSSNTTDSNQNDFVHTEARLFERRIRSTLT